MSNFVHLHNHSYYSLLDGMASPKALVNKALELGYNSIALTDHGNCGGLFKFNKECLSHNIKPILGMEAYVTKDMAEKSKDSHYNHLVILAKNKIGYKNLIKINSMAYLKGFYYKPRIDFNLLSQYHEGLIVTSACCFGEIPNLLWEGKLEDAVSTVERYKGLFGDDFYLEIMLHKYNDTCKQQEEKEKKIANILYKFGKKHNIKMICTNDIHYASREDAASHDVLLSIQTLDTIKNPDRLTFGSSDFYLKSEKEMFDLFGKAPELLSNTLEIAEKVESNIIESSSDLLPRFILPEGFSDEISYLRSLVDDGMKIKGLQDKAEYTDRVNYEFSVISKCGYTKYFLILWDIINFARTNGIAVGPGRGSAVSSLCLYVLGITKVDPVKYELIFERFLNPERISPPDVDVDFDYNRRDEVYNYIIRKYGAEYCCNIGTYNSFKTRAALRSTAKALDLGNDYESWLKAKEHNKNVKLNDFKNSLDVADTICKCFPLKSLSIDDALKQDANLNSIVKKYPQLFECARKIERVVSSAGVHPAGILLCKDPVIEHVPLKDSKGVICSQYDGPEVEKIGLLKFDLLALKTLTVIDSAVKLIKLRHGKNIQIDEIIPDDKEVFKLFNSSHPTMGTQGIFQFEAYGITKLLKDIHVDSFEDIIVANALYRPGPLKAGMHIMYCNYKHGRQKIEPLHPKMLDVLKKTYSILVYQEDIMRVSKELAGFTNGQADTLRKAIGKKDFELLKSQRELFVAGCVKNGIQNSVAEKIFKHIYHFGDYGFNRSHSAAYGFLAYQTAWLKRYYPIEFMCGLLTSEIHNNDKDENLQNYEKQAQNMGFVCMPQDINKSGLSYKIELGLHKRDSREIEFLRRPLTTLKGVGEKAVLNIVENQPYSDLEDFLSKIDMRLVNIRVFKVLVENRCMYSSFKMDNQEIMREYEAVKIKLDKQKKLEKKNREKSEKESCAYEKSSLFEFDFDGKDIKI